MAPNRLRSVITTGALVIATLIAWVLFAPTAIGGSTAYVVTNGISMEPRFHSGDLALVRPASSYRVGDVVAYRSSLLHVVVLHRIIAIRGDRYVFKGDNNDFIDPVHPTRSQLIGLLWIHLPGGGRVLQWLHTPVMGALLAAAIGGLLLFGTAEKRRRRRRRDRRSDHPRSVTSPPASSPPIDLRTTALGCAIAVALSAALAVLAFVTPGTTTLSHKDSYVQQGHFSYTASAPSSAVYPGGSVGTGDPVFLNLVHRLRVTLRYRFLSAAPHRTVGTERLVLRLSGPTGWSRSIALTGSRRFRGTFIASATLDLPAIQALLAQIQRLTGIPDTSGYNAAVAAEVRVNGAVAGRRLAASFEPQLSFAIQPLQLQPGAAPGATPGSAGQSSAGFSPSAAGTVTTTVPAANSVGLAGQKLRVALLRRVALAALVISLMAGIVVSVLLRRAGTFDEAARIQARYGAMLVPILAGDDLGWPPVDVPSFESLVRLAQSAGLMILHHHGEQRDTYLVNDDGTVYRYQAKLPKVVWGEWSEPRTQLADAADLSAVGKSLGDAAANITAEA